MSDWMSDEAHTGRKVVVESLKSRIADMEFRAKGCREAYKKDYMRVPLTFLADAFDEAAFVLQSRLDEVIGSLSTSPERREQPAKVEEAWRPIASAPKGSWPDGPNDTRHPDYVEPPRLWLLLDDGEPCVGYFDAYYAEGGSGYDGGSFWVEKFSSERVTPTHWKPLSELPVAAVRSERDHPQVRQEGQ